LADKGGGVLQGTVLLVHSDAKEAAVAARAIGGVLMAMPVHIQTGEAAILWLTQNHCDACVVDYQLSGIDGVETLIRIRQRLPNLPVVIVSGANSEHAAIAAWHAGAVDYVPKAPGVYPAVATILQRVLQKREGLPAAALAVPLSDNTVPPDLVRPTYQNRLRAIGRQLDLYGYRSVNILEVGGGFIARAALPGSRSHQALEFPDEHMPHLISSTISARGEGNHQRARSTLLPTGYEDFLRAVGFRLDNWAAEVVTITELTSLVAVGGMALEDSREQGMLAPLEWVLGAEEIEAILDEAYRRRTASPAPRGSLMGRLLRGQAGSASGDSRE
jgi:CheY-like chemotaxis protein